MGHFVRQGQLFFNKIIIIINYYLSISYNVLHITYSVSTFWKENHNNKYNSTTIKG